MVVKLLTTLRYALVGYWQWLHERNNWMWPLSIGWWVVSFVVCFSLIGSEPAVNSFWVAGGFALIFGSITAAALTFVTIVLVGVIMQVKDFFREMVLKGRRISDWRGE